MEGRMTHHSNNTTIINSTSCIYTSKSLFPISPTAKSPLSRPSISFKRPSFTFLTRLPSEFGGSPLVRMEDPFTASLSSVSPRKNLTTCNHLRHVESMAHLPSGADRITRLNALILGDALASEEDDLIFPSEVFSSQAHVSSSQKVPSILIIFSSIYLFNTCFQLDPSIFCSVFGDVSKVGPRSLRILV